MMPSAPPVAGGPGGPTGPGGPGGPRGPVRVGGGSDGPDDGSGRRRTPGGILASRIVSTIAAVALLLVTGIGYFVNQGGTSDAQTKASQVDKIPGGGITILLVGSDSRSHADGTPLSAEELKLVSTTESSGTNTDTLMLLHIPADGARATAVSIPRDTWIDESVTSAVKGPYSNGSEGEYKPNKINAFYGTAKTYSAQYLTSQGVTGAERERRSSEAGRQMLISVLSKFTGMYIDHFAEVNLIAFYTISTALQGVPVCLKAAVNDSFSGANFPAGLQEVEGTSALAFVRQRHGLPGGDLDRVRRQQAFLSGAIKKVLSAPTTIPSLADAAQQSLVMDKSLDLLTLGQQMQALSGGQVTFETLPTHGAAADAGTDALATDPAEVKAFFAKMRGTASSAGGSKGAATSAAAQKLTVDVQNGTMTADLGKSVAALLEGKGMTVTKPADMPGKSNSNQLETTEVRYPSGAKANADSVVTALGFGTATQSGDVAAGHVLVVAGKDAPAPSGLRAILPAFVVGGTPPIAGATAPAVALPAAAGAVPDSIDGVACIN